MRTPVLIAAAASLIALICLVSPTGVITPAGATQRVEPTPQSTGPRVVVSVPRTDAREIVRHSVVLESPSSAERPAVRVAVVDSLGQPLPGAIVLCRIPGDVRDLGTTDDTGITEAPVQIAFGESSKGFLRARCGLVESEEIPVSAAQVGRDALRVVMPPAGWVAVEVRYPRSSAIVANVISRSSLSLSCHECRRFGPLDTMFTLDENGFADPVLVPLNHTFRLSDQFGLCMPAIDQIRGPTEPGETARVVIDFGVEAPVLVGVLEDPSGAADAGYVPIGIRTAHDEFGRFATSDDAGRFVVRLEPSAIGSKVEILVDARVNPLIDGARFKLSTTVVVRTGVQDVGTLRLERIPDPYPGTLKCIDMGW